MIVLGIESSCDDTAAAVVEDGPRVLSSIVASQVETHRPFGGVVPELASRRHIEAISAVVEEAILQAGIRPEAIAAVAATRGPGLVGSLLVGFSFAKGFAWARGLPLAGVNHLEAHIHSLFLEGQVPEYPLVSLLVSGGHTALYLVSSPFAMELLGQTRDDAAGEAFDKVAKMLGLGYPGGPVIEKLARRGDPRRFPFPRPALEQPGFDFSFSGIKTAVGRLIERRKPLSEGEASDLAASFQEAVVEVLVAKLLRAAEAKGCPRIAVVGGVAANTPLRERVAAAAHDLGLASFIPPPRWCGDNAAMVAAAGLHLLRAGHRCGPESDVFSRNG
ncbi:MAG: tRNA (adenosine(37)-N6)-threonylcarbamoyltransferase complex transferase subunit TsaD [Desulfobacterales bacterium]